ncbi:hypothetical protein KP79_PYT21624 [Mizuhopecten yessoensis]|uniref:Uncharacterized protein n=1 Tax=Mizuhopecten yessoensis TaxID=6573 RepID=A0A210R0A6_MIZYE|nr:hypothetical protein KP79_PYT21624 [Mizuhopecten yessoensis]
MEYHFFEPSTIRLIIRSLLFLVLFSVTSGCPISTSGYQDDGRFLCFPSPNSDKYCICFDIGDSSFTYVPRNEFPAQLAFKVQDGHFEDNLPADDHAINLRMDLSPHERTTGIDVKAVKSLLLDLMRQVSTYKKQSKRSHVLAKRPFDSISYGSYFGGFGKK